MADEKKPEGKPAGPPAPSQPDPFIEIVWLLLAAFFIVYLINEFISLVSSGDISSFGPKGATLQKSIVLLFWKIFAYIKYIAILLSLLLVVAVVYLYRKLVDLRRNEREKFYTKNTEIEEGSKLGNPQWERILNHVESTNESDWRLAILEADIMLDTLLDNMRLSGETMADKLKAVEKSDFLTIDNAWEAHKVRNQIAHEGGTFVLNQEEAKRVIELYKSVFKEFRII